MLCGWGGEGRHRKQPATTAGWPCPGHRNGPTSQMPSEVTNDPDPPPKFLWLLPEDVEIARYLECLQKEGETVGREFVTENPGGVAVIAGTEAGRLPLPPRTGRGSESYGSHQTPVQTLGSQGRWATCGLLPRTHLAQGQGHPQCCAK